MKSSGWLRTIALLCAGCASTPGSRSQTSDQERLLTVVQSEALRLVEAWRVDGKEH